ncbi:MAG: PIN domain-containing protein [Acidobacteria bacterium]|nr:MAG: PIN domain-containing protein [Acidobacteriota bacterium]
MTTELFLDAVFAIALSSPSDQYHSRARALSAQMKRASHRLVTTRAVLLEIADALSRPRDRQAAVELLSALEEDPTVEIVPLSEGLFSRGLELYAQHADKGWGLTDCVSFVVMRERGMTEALTCDSHFRQAGFRTLLDPEGS